MKRFVADDEGLPSFSLNIQDQETDSTVQRTKLPIKKRTIKLQEPPAPQRKSERKRRPVVKLTMTETAGKRYLEEPVPLAEDTAVSEEEEDKE